MKPIPPDLHGYVMVKNTKIETAALIRANMQAVSPTIAFSTSVQVSTSVKKANNISVLL